MINYSICTAKEPAACDMLILPIFEDKGLDIHAKQIDQRVKGLLSEVLKNKDFEGKKRQTSLVYTTHKDIPRVLFLGLGKSNECNIKMWKQVIGFGIVQAQAKKSKKIAVIIPASVISRLGAKITGSESAIACELSNYVYDEYKEEKSKVTRIENCELIGISPTQKKSFGEGMEEGLKIADGVNFVRHLANMPPSDLSPECLAEQAELVGAEDKNIQVKILSLPEIQKLGMGCLLGVANGSQHEPKFIIAEYWGAEKNKKARSRDNGGVYEPYDGGKPTVLVGKGITYDSGGITLKPMDFLTNMKYDMLGAASVIGIVKIASALGIKKNIVALAPTCENMPGGSAYKPDDVLRAMNGKTVEVKNTDAEGRLILADGLCYAKKYKPREVIDLATLTGACLVAIGMDRVGLFSEDEKMVKKLEAAGTEVGEELWRLPMGEEFSEGLKSDVADISNIGASRYGGASVGAAFLQYFVDFPWAHIDIAAAGFVRESPKSWLHPGTSATGVQTLIKYLKS